MKSFVRLSGSSVRDVLLACAGIAAAATSAFAAPVEFQAAIAESDPVLYYQFNEASGVAVNHGSLGSDYDATYFGTPFRAVGTAEGDAGVRFDSADDYLESASVAPESLAGNPTFSAEALVFVLADGAAAVWAPMLHWGISSPGDPTMKSVYFSFSSSDASEFFAGFYNGGLQTVSSWLLGEWHHVVWIRTGGGAANVGTTVYVDGSVASLENDPELPSNGATPSVVNTAFRVDRAQDFTRWFTGNLDEVALYDRELSAEEVADHFSKTGTCGQPKCIDFDGSCRGCAKPVSAGLEPLASDALAVLRRAVGSRKCNTCVCDVDSSGSVVASDALITLKRAVGQAVGIGCPAP